MLDTLETIQTSKQKKMHISLLINTANHEGETTVPMSKFSLPSRPHSFGKKCV